MLSVCLWGQYFTTHETVTILFPDDCHRCLPQVQPGEGGKAVLSDMRSLSGGERSFSTVCFVLSLWAIAEAPFRALDEFDVYMVKKTKKKTVFSIKYMQPY